MALLKLLAPFAAIRGTLQKRGIINRRKMYKDENGKILFEGRQEAYAVRHSRDYRKNPPQGEELRNINVFREANRLTTELLHAGTYTPDALAALPLEERNRIEDLQTTLSDYKRRYKAQTKTPDPQAPLDPHTRRPKRYVMLNTFIRAILIQQLKQHNPD